MSNAPISELSLKGVRLLVAAFWEEIKGAWDLLTVGAKRTKQKRCHFHTMISHSTVLILIRTRQLLSGVLLIQPLNQP